MCTYINFSARRYIALTVIGKVRKCLGKNKFVHTKNHTGSKFYKTSLGLLCTSGIVVVHVYCGFFSAALTNRQIPKRICWSIFWSIFCQFEKGLRRQLCIHFDGIFTDC